MEEEVAALLQSAGAASSRAVAESEDKLAMKVRMCVYVYCVYVCTSACAAIDLG